MGGVCVCVWRGGGGVGDGAGLGRLRGGVGGGAWTGVGGGSRSGDKGRASCRQCAGAGPRCILQYCRPGGAAMQALRHGSSVLALAARPGGCCGPPAQRAPAWWRGKDRLRLQQQQPAAACGGRLAEGRKASMRDSRYSALWAVDCTAREGTAGQAPCGLRRDAGEAGPQSGRGRRRRCPASPNPGPNSNITSSHPFTGGLANSMRTRASRHPSLRPCHAARLRVSPVPPSPAPTPHTPTHTHLYNEDDAAGGESPVGGAEHEVAARGWGCGVGWGAWGRGWGLGCAWQAGALGGFAVGTLRAQPPSACGGVIAKLELAGARGKQPR